MSSPDELSSVGSLGNLYLVLQPDDSEGLPAPLDDQAVFDISVLNPTNSQYVNFHQWLSEADYRRWTETGVNNPLFDQWKNQVERVVSYIWAHPDKFEDGGSNDLTARVIGRYSDDPATRRSLSINLQLAVGIVTMFNEQQSIYSTAPIDAAPYVPAGLATVSSIGNAYIIYQRDGEEVLPTATFPTNGIDFSPFFGPAYEEFADELAQTNQALSAQWHSQVTTVFNWLVARGSIGTENLMLTSEEAQHLGYNDSQLGTMARNLLMARAILLGYAPPIQASTIGEITTSTQAEESQADIGAVESASDAGSDQDAGYDYAETDAGGIFDATDAGSSDEPDAGGLVDADEVVSSMPAVTNQTGR